MAENHIADKDRAATPPVVIEERSPSVILEKYFHVIEVLILTPVILVIIGVFCIPTVFYALPSSEV